jgi:hypothetical protein
MTNMRVRNVVYKFLLRIYTKYNKQKFINNISNAAFPHICHTIDKVRLFNNLILSHFKAGHPVGSTLILVGGDHVTGCFSPPYFRFVNCNCQAFKRGNTKLYHSFSHILLPPFARIIIFLLTGLCVIQFSNLI